jgi:hypothetical protein
MTDNTVLNADATFFKALLAADRAALDAVLAPDFVLVGVADGQIVPVPRCWTWSAHETSNSWTSSGIVATQCYEAARVWP